MTDKSVRIVFENEKYIVIHKMPGIAVQTASVSSPDVCSILKNHLHGGYLGVVHRLDQPVEGLLVFAKDKDAAGKLSDDLVKGKLKKTYKAVCYGMAEKSDTNVCYMKKSAAGRCEIGEGADHKRAELSYVLLDSVNGTSLLDISIATGRFHQIRAQMAHLGHPIIGDEKYGSEESRKMSESMGARYPALCADRLSFFDETEKKERVFEIMPTNKIFDIYGATLNDPEAK